MVIEQCDNFSSREWQKYVVNRKKEVLAFPFPFWRTLLTASFIFLHAKSTSCLFLASTKLCDWSSFGEVSIGPIHSRNFVQWIDSVSVDPSEVVLNILQYYSKICRVPPWKTFDSFWALPFASPGSKKKDMFFSACWPSVRTGFCMYEKKGTIQSFPWKILLRGTFQGWQFL